MTILTNGDQSKHRGRMQTTTALKGMDRSWDIVRCSGLINGNQWEIVTYISDNIGYTMDIYIYMYGTPQDLPFNQI